MSEFKEFLFDMLESALTGIGSCFLFYVVTKALFGGAA